MFCATPGRETVGEGQLVQVISASKRKLPDSPGKVDERTQQQQVVGGDDAVCSKSHNCLI